MEQKYSREEAAEKINKILEPYKRCNFEFADDSMVISWSVDIHSKKVRKQITEIIARTENVTSRTAESMSAEWLFHNIAYALHVKRASARDVNIDYTFDRRRIVVIITAVLEKLGLG